MRIFLFILFGVLAVVGIGVAIFPMSVAAGMVASSIPAFSYVEASGSVWNGKLSRVKYQDQALGDVSLQIDFLKAVQGKAAGKLGIQTPTLSGQGAFSVALSDKTVELTDLKLSGNTAAIPGIPVRLRAVDGHFRLEIPKATIKGQQCVAGEGTVWSDVLARAEPVLQWKGPDLTGPISCIGGRFTAEAAGRAEAGDEVSAKVDIGSNLKGQVTARVKPVTQGLPKRLQDLGFVPGADGYALDIHVGAGPGT